METYEELERKMIKAFGREETEKIRQMAIQTKKESEEKNENSNRIRNSKRASEGQ